MVNWKDEAKQAFVCFWGVSWSRTVKGKGFWLFRTHTHTHTHTHSHSLTHWAVSVNLFNKSKKYYLMVPVVRKLNNEALLAADQPLGPCSTLLANCLSFHASHSSPASGRLAGVPHPGVQKCWVKLRESESPKVISTPEQVCIKF